MTGLFIQWFYLKAPSRHVVSMRQTALALYNFFSIQLLLSTIFSPWRHDAVAIDRLPINQWGQAFVNNFVSRFIGFCLRFVVIVTGILVIMIFMLGALLFTFAWYLLPILLISSIIYGLSLLLGSMNV